MRPSEAINAAAAKAILFTSCLLTNHYRCGRAGQRHPSLGIGSGSMYDDDALALHARKEWPAIVVNQGRIGVQIMAPLPAMGQKWRWLARSTRCGRAPTRDASLDTMLLSIAGAGSGCLRPPRLSMFHRPGWPTRPLAGTRRRRSRSYTRRARPSRRRNRRQRDWRIRRTPAV